MSVPPSVWEELVCPEHPWAAVESEFGDAFCTTCGGSPSLIVSITARDEEIAEALMETADADCIAVALAAAREGYPR